MPADLGIYVHIPFCAGGKCPYCDFYSVPYALPAARDYLQAFERQAEPYAPRAAGRRVNTVYFGGGTPSLLGDGLTRMLGFLKSRFAVTEDAEITLEANPATLSGDLPLQLRRAGFNRLSIGMQSASPAELRRLGRKHTPEDTAAAVEAARSAGFDNISLDLMLATPGQTLRSLQLSVEAAAALSPEHVSAYLLKVESGTPFSEQRALLGLPGPEDQADFYLTACEKLESYGFQQYEISNFARDGRISRHNLKYWNCDEYLGFGPGAHSFFEGRRFFFERNLEAFQSGASVIDEGTGGGLAEYVMLRLRLCAGLEVRELRARYDVGFEIFDGSLLSALLRAGYVEVDEATLRLTRSGFLVSNSVISELLFKSSLMDA